MAEVNESAARSRRFYAEFLNSHMVGYRLHKSPRIESIKRRVASVLEPGQRVLEIGCGIGLISEFVALNSAGSSVFATDLSEDNLGYARATVAAANIQWKVVDAVTDNDSLTAWLGGQVDLIVMADVRGTHVFHAVGPAACPL